MYHIFSTIVRRKSFKAIILTALIVSGYTSVNAQMYSATDAPKRSNGGLTYGGNSGGSGGSGGGFGSTWAISLSGGYDVPTGDLGTTFKAAPTFSFSVLRNYGDFTFNTTIGYVSYKPKMDTVYFYGNDPTQGYVQYGNFSALEIYAGAAYNIQVSDNAKVYIGANIGTYYNFFSYTSNDGQGNISTSNTTEGQSYVAPKLGVDFMVSDNISIGLEAKYNFMLSSDSGTGDAYDSGYSTTVNKSFSGNVALTYHF
jgi:hypothetical protein